jgi:hypothetical protein
MEASAGWSGLYHLTGEFNSWDRSSPPFRKAEYKRWEPVLPSMEGKTAIKQGEKVKVLVNGDDSVSPCLGKLCHPASQGQAA